METMFQLEAYSVATDELLQEVQLFGTEEEIRQAFKIGNDEPVYCTDVTSRLPNTLWGKAEDGLKWFVCQYEA